MRATSFVCTAAAVLIASTSATAFAGDLFVPKAYPTIEDAVAHANPGDRVVVKGGRHEAVYIARAGVTVVGRGATLVGSVWIDAKGVTLQGFRMAGGSQIVITADDVVVKGNSSRGNVRYWLTVQGGDRATIEGNVSRGGAFDVLRGTGTVIRSNRLKNVSTALVDGGALVESNTFSSVRLDAEDTTLRSNRIGEIAGYGDRTTLDGNVVTGLITLVGDGIQATGNEMSRGGMQVIGDRATVTSNTVHHSPLGIAVVGEDAEVSDNDLDVGMIQVNRDGGGFIYSQCPGIVVESQSPGSVIEHNVITHTTGTGMTLNVVGASILDNVVHGVSSVTSVSIVGSQNTFSGNEISHSPNSSREGNGVEVSGDGNVIQDNDISATTLDGIVVAGGAGNQLIDNVVARTHGCGILVGDATDTSISGCTITACDLGLMNQSYDTVVTGSDIVRNSLIDVLDLGGFARFEDNKIGKLSHDAWMAPHQ